VIQTVQTLFPYHKQAFTIDEMKTKCVCLKNELCSLLDAGCLAKKPAVAVKAQVTAATMCSSHTIL
jgi:hypothetical protein